MRKIYVLLMAMVLSISAFAQSSIRDFYGDWTFTFLDNNDGGKQVSMVLNFQYVDNPGEYVFFMPENKGLIYVFSAPYKDNTLTFTFDNCYFSYVKIGDYYYEEDVTAVYNGDPYNTTRTTLVYNTETKEISDLQLKYGSLGMRAADAIGFKGSYSGPENGTFDYTLVSMKYGVEEEEEEDTGSISVSLPLVMYYPSSLTTAVGFAQAEVQAVGYEDYEVWYNLYLDNDAIVEDTKVEPDEGDYLIYIDDLEFGRNYTLNVWATSGDYVSPKVTETLSTGWSAPDIRVSAKAENIGITSADITVTTNYWDIEYSPVHFTITAESANGPEVEPIEIEDKGNGTFYVTGLTGNTQYTYTIGFSAYDSFAGEYVKENAATVNFTTLAPTIELDGINYSPITQGATFVVTTINAEGLADDQNVDVYFQLEGSQDAPAKAEFEEGVYKYSFTDLEAEKEYTAVIFGGVGTYGEEGFIKGEEYKENFTTGAGAPEITITFAEGSYSSSPQSTYYAQITATPTIEAVNAPEYDVYYNLYLGATKHRTDVKVEPTEGEYIITIGELSYSRLYKVEVYATVGDGAYTSETASFEITTCDEPGVKIVKTEVLNVTETSADIVVEYEASGLSGDINFQVKVAADNAPEVAPVITTETEVTFNLTGLTPGQIYTYHVTVTADAGTMYQANRAVIVETLAPSKVITLGDISYSQIDSGVIFVVKGLEAQGFDEGTEFDVYFVLDGSNGEPEKAELVKDDEGEHYEYTFKELNPKSPYTAQIFAGTGEYGKDEFFQGTVYKKNFVTGEQSGVETIVTDSENDVRYFNLQGAPISRPAAGTICIKVEGNKASKVIIK